MGLFSSSTTRTGMFSSDTARDLCVAAGDESPLLSGVWGGGWEGLLGFHGSCGEEDVHRRAEVLAPLNFNFWGCEWPLARM
jgi:hypothetical protein